MPMLLIMMLAMGLCRCSNQAVLQTSTDANQTTQPAAVLQVDVTPSTGISIVLDDNKIANTSPCTIAIATPGTHILHVRGMGFYPMTLPIHVAAGDTLHIPVFLRQRTDVDTAVLPVEAAPAQEPNVLHTIPHAAHHLSEPASAKPRMMRPIDIQWASSLRTASVVLDGIPIHDTKFTLHVDAGQLVVGAMRMHYQVSTDKSVSLVQLIIPRDDAIWYQDGVAVEGGTQVLLDYAFVNISRKTHAGQQSLMAKRLN